MIDVITCPSCAPSVGAKTKTCWPCRWARLLDMGNKSLWGAVAPNIKRVFDLIGRMP